jgi:hypothetical protein
MLKDDLPDNCITAFGEMCLVLEEDIRKHVICAYAINELFKRLLGIISELR